MGGGLSDDWELTTPESDRTIVLIGRTGNGKSATGNSILGRKAFKSQFKLSAVTSTCELQTAVLEDKRTVKVIDTPGLFDTSDKSELIGKEIINCITLAKDGIHAVLMVFSAQPRFTKEEESSIRIMKLLFGEKIVDHMIVVFTGGDILEEETTLTDFINDGCPEPLKNILQQCNNRVMLFDNRTLDKTKRNKQVDQLLSLVDLVVADNGGRPFSGGIFDELKVGAFNLRNKEREIEVMEGCSEEQISKFKEQIHKSYDDQIRQVIEMIERKLNDAVGRLEKQLEEERAARCEAENCAKEARNQSAEEIKKLREDLKKAQEESQEFRNRKCVIL